jgi:hypothetical protein
MNILKLYIPVYLYICVCVCFLVRVWPASLLMIKILPLVYKMLKTTVLKRKEDMIN